MKEITAIYFKFSDPDVSNLSQQKFDAWWNEEFQYFNKNEVVSFLHCSLFHLFVYCDCHYCVSYLGLHIVIMTILSVCVFIYLFMHACMWMVDV